jgi:SAM-dependent methyltransferase
LTGGRDRRRDVVLVPRLGVSWGPFIGGCGLSVNQGVRATMAEPSWRELNRAMWNERVPLHLGSRLYDLSKFKAGALSLRRHEIADLGDVRGKELVHLQCHFGKDTLSWARLGAHVTGLDFSEAAVRAAVALAAEIGVDARFVTADVYDALEALGGRTFDIVYTGVGALCWLPDMTRWAKVIFDLLQPGGELYLYEFHPLKWIFGETDSPEILDAYFTSVEGFRLGGVTYADATVCRSSPAGQVEPGSMNPSPVSIISRTFPRLKHRESDPAGKDTPFSEECPVTIHWPGSMSEPPWMSSSAACPMTPAAWLADRENEAPPWSPNCQG